MCSPEEINDARIKARNAWQNLFKLKSAMTRNKKEEKVFKNKYLGVNEKKVGKVKKKLAREASAAVSAGRQLLLHGYKKTDHSCSTRLDPLSQTRRSQPSHSQTLLPEVSTIISTAEPWRISHSNSFVSNKKLSTRSKSY